MERKKAAFERLLNIMDEPEVVALDKSNLLRV